MTKEVKTPPAEGKPTEEPFITVCQCGGVLFKVKKRTKTAINIECIKCNLKSSVKGNLAPVRVGSTEIAFAVKEKVIRPDPDSGNPTSSSSGEGNKPPTLAEQGLRTMRAQITEGQDANIQKSLELVRILNFGNDAYRANQWQGIALEAMAVDFAAGVDPIAIQIYDAMQAAVDEEVKKYKEEHPDRNMPKRRMRDTRSRVREELTKKLKIWAVEQYESPPKSDDEVASLDEYRDATDRKRKEDEADDRIIDDGKFSKVIMEGLVDYRDEAVSAGARAPSFLCSGGDKYADIKRQWDNKGGVLLQLYGDPRTKDGSGRAPSIYLWAKDVEDLPDLPMLYDDAMSDVITDPQLKIVEFLKDDQPASGLTEETQVKK